MNILIVDDEQNARETVKAYLKKTPLAKATIEEADSIDSTLKALDNFKPDLALLDINLSDGTSFDLLSRLDQIHFKIIFISAHDEYAINAFRFNALDYILKPINPLEFSEAIKKVMAADILPTKDQLSSLNQSISEKSSNRLVLKDSQSIYVVDIKDIIHCKSESNYTVFYLEDGSQITISKTLAEYEELLRGKGFFRPHRSYLINLYQIKKYDKREGGFIQMKNNENVPLSRGKKDIFMQLIEKL